MNRCNHPDHPYCTVWVLPGDATCAHGHPQLPSADHPQAAPAPAARHAAEPACAGGETSTPATAPSARPCLHVSGFDPRAAGGRQLLRLEPRGLPADSPARLTLQAGSRLRLGEGARQTLVRGADGAWLPVFLEFTAAGLEHGQYRIELVLHGRLADGRSRSWVATPTILVPRLDASLLDIHEAFLATRGKLRVHADDASIARVRGSLAGGGRLDIDVHAHDAGIAHLDLEAGGGRVDLGYSSIAWDEELFEVELPADLVHAAAATKAVSLPLVPAPRYPCPASAACIVGNGDGTGPRYLRLFAREECVLGRLDAGAGADILLAHHDGSGLARDGLTRRISSRHALLRRGRAGFEIEDVSRYGLLVDGAWPGKGMPLALRAGMRIELTASIPGVLVLEVAAVLAHGLVLRRADAGAAYEWWVLLEPEQEADACATDVPGLPLLFHRNGGFWRRGADGADVPLTPDAVLPGGARFTAQPYPEPASLPASSETAPQALS